MLINNISSLGLPIKGNEFGLKEGAVDGVTVMKIRLLEALYLYLTLFWLELDKFCITGSTLKLEVTIL